MSTILPPRRHMPPPLPSRVETPDNQGTDSPQTLSLAARIASLQLDRATQQPHRNSGKPDRKPDPSHEQSNFPYAAPGATTRTFALVVAGLDPNYLNKLLARPPPPVPDKRSQEPEPGLNAPPQLPPHRRIPPKLPSPTQPDHDREPNGHPSESSCYTQNEEDDEGLYHNPESADITTYATREVATAAGGMFPVGTCIKCHDFSIVDAHAAQFPRQYVSSLDELAYSLTGPFAYETEKARAIFTWLHHNIRYDTQSFFAGTVKPATPDSTLSSGLAVCDGYSGLFVGLAQKVGLQVYKVGGHGKGFGYRDPAPGEPVPKMSTNHAWNCVLMDGEWRLIDATWGAGALNGSTYDQRFDPSWFTSTPVEFARRHFPSDSAFQLIADEDGGPLDWADYILTPPGPVIFSDFHRLGFLIDLLQPTPNIIENGQTVTFTLFKRCEHMTNDESKNYVHVLLTPGRKPVPLHPNAEGGWSLTYQVVGETEVSLMFIATVDGQDAKGIGIQGFNNALDRKAMSFGGLAKWTVA